jgi:hypothetical protein
LFLEGLSVKIYFIGRLVLVLLWLSLSTVVHLFKSTIT